MTSLSLQFQNRILRRLKTPVIGELRVFYIGGYWRGSNDMVAQMLHGLKAAGANVFDFNTDDHPDALDCDGQLYDRGTSGPVWLVREKLFPLIVRFRPHVLICNAGGLSFRPHDADTLRGWGIRLVGIALSDPDVYEPTTRRIFRNFDVFYSNDKQTVDVYNRGGIESYQLPIATNDLFFRPVPSQSEYACDVLHLGAAHPDRIAPVKELIHHFDTHVYGENWEKYEVPGRGLIYGEKTLIALNSARITVIFSRTPSGRQTVKVGIFDFLAAGALVATEDFPELHRYFDTEKELIAFHDVADMVDKVRYYLDRPRTADDIRNAGRDKVLSKFTWRKTWPAILAPVLGAKKLGKNQTGA